MTANSNKEKRSLIDLMLEKRLGVLSHAGAERVRKRLFVDPKVQGALIVRVILYWVVCLLSITLMLLCWRIVTGPARPFYTHFDAMWFHFGPALVASFVILPLVISDIVRVSNRFTGPLVRLRRSMRALADGRPVRPIRFRQGDFWQDFADEFNAVLLRVQELEEQLDGSEKTSPSCEAGDTETADKGHADELPQGDREHSLHA